MIGVNVMTMSLFVRGSRVKYVSSQQSSGSLVLYKETGKTSQSIKAKRIIVFNWYSVHEYVLYS